MPVIFQRTVTLPDPAVHRLLLPEMWSSPQANYPGIYAFFDGSECLYVGKSVNSIGLRIVRHLYPSITTMRHTDGTLVVTGKDSQHVFHARLAEAVRGGNATVQCFECPDPDTVEGDVVACFKPTMQGKPTWATVRSGGATTAIQCIRVS